MYPAEVSPFDLYDDVAGHSEWQSRAADDRQKSIRSNRLQVVASVQLSLLYYVLDFLQFV